MIPRLRALTGLPISEIRHRIAMSQPLLEIVAFRNDWQETRYKLVRIARQIADGSLPLAVTEVVHEIESPVPLPMLLNLIQHFRQLELQTQMDVALETGEIDDPRDFIPQDADWTK